MRRQTTRTKRAWLRDAVSLLAMVWSVPLAILLVGTPIALVLAALVWLGRWVRSGI